MVKPELFVTPGYGEHMLERLHYSQALRIGDRIETSGQGGWSDNFQIPEKVENEIELAFHNLERTLATAGAEWKHVVHVNSYHVGGFPPVRIRRRPPVRSLWADSRLRSCSVSDDLRAPIPG